MDIKAEVAAATDYIRTLPDVVDLALVGSAVYMPPDRVNDVDFAVLLDSKVAASLYADELIRDSQSWQACGRSSSDSGWTAVRRGNLNLMLCTNRKVFDGYKLAMEVCKALNLQTRDERIVVCRIVRDGWSADMFGVPAVVDPQEILF